MLRTRAGGDGGCGYRPIMSSLTEEFLRLYYDSAPRQHNG
jgi:hypothetical protein